MDSERVTALLSLVENAEVAWTEDEDGEIEWVLAPEGKRAPTRAEIEAEVIRLKQAAVAEKEQQKVEREAKAEAVHKATTIIELRKAIIDYFGIPDPGSRVAKG